MSSISDFDPQQTREWLESLASVVELDGPERAQELLTTLLRDAHRQGALSQLPVTTDYVNSVQRDAQPAFPGDLDLEARLEDIIRWNAAVMVAKANHDFDGLGGHISTFASSATLYEVAFNHFFRGKDGEGTGDQIFYQGHGSPGMYARSFLEGRLTEDQIIHFRRESARGGTGLSSYPHPRLMPDYWEFPTVSMGIGPMSAIYQARFNKYLHARGMADTSQSRVWAYLGDGETDEPESAGSLAFAGREHLDNLTFIINCNLQRLDGPVRGNGKIVQELEGLYRGAGWNVIKLIWGSGWDDLFARDHDGHLLQALNTVVDGAWQHFAEGSGAELREKFFGQSPELLALVEHLSDDELGALQTGAHDREKVFAAYQAAVDHQGAPSVILAHSVKGYKLGQSFAGKNSTHQMKKMSENQLVVLRDNLNMPFTDEELEAYPFYHPGPDSPEIQYLHARRAALGGPLPKRKAEAAVSVGEPDPALFDPFKAGVKQEASTTMVFAQLISRLLKDKEVGKRVVPIIPDEARTFGMDPLFKQVGIYAAKGQTYEPVDKSMLLYYREAEDGQLLQEGITEAGAISSFIAAGTTHSTHAEPMIPFYVFYSMFGFQRTGDQAWAFGDARGRGFLMGATAGRTTLNGEGLQHEDGQSHLLASTVPNIMAYDPSFAFELAVLIKEGMRRMVKEEEDIFYYITIHNENYVQPPMPEGAEQGIIEGLYPFRKAPKKHKLKAQLFGSASIMMQVLKAQEMLSEQFGVSADVWSATSYQQLRNDALSCERWNRLHPMEEERVPNITRILEGVDGPFIAASDYMKAVPEMITRFIPGVYVPLGTDGFGMSDMREALRRHFEVDAASIVIATLDGLRQQGSLQAKDVAKAIKDLGYDTEKIDPLTI